jgi:hypothetical protein
MESCFNEHCGEVRAIEMVNEYAVDVGFMFQYVCAACGCQFEVLFIK